ncbi:probable DNA-3-methyladenine glycosylase isoform X2 [Zootermopsis nevadensis]|uniref:DNA-3-methyladenine glycosylase n=2 Tax=Zootermopsis nevadensis TaxID=136037 RepID=A0A067RT87_ZOONE|nr:probable DNA-3-methyladenine glycosylase isoform X2 [Zootermopsis nevadensis]XP_021942414.1 probable DNA-3-methyladenine glycosylase isoform X2 [Zootermopsis nevadensis]XP_021942415.1 probable DNA-3-methyladenine glycosylase isoform X2 [Zootermopsis nevadensis]KDR23034.1 DNA-3-methyladenine glycosylase [Zootermopsis nevadensis]
MELYCQSHFCNCCLSSTKMQNVNVRSDYFSNTASASGSNTKMNNHQICGSVHITENVMSSDEQSQTYNKSVHKRVKLSKVLNADDIFFSSHNSNRTPTYGLNRLKDSFYDVPCEDLAKGLLGKILVRRLSDGTVLKGHIVETECYLGGDDKASHSYKGRITERSKPMYMKPGTTYVYITYGMYHCFNISSQGSGAAVLLRALEPLEGLEFMHLERGKRKKSTSSKPKELKAHELCSGPAKLCMSFNITKSLCNEQDLTAWDGLWVEEDESNQKSLDPCHIVTSHRIGIDSVGREWASKPLRFYLLGNSSVSRRDRAREKELWETIKHSSSTKDSFFPQDPAYE